MNGFNKKKMEKIDKYLFKQIFLCREELQKGPIVRAWREFDY